MIIISPWASKVNEDGSPNAKDFPYWTELLKMIKEPVVQIGLDGEQQLTKDFRKDLTIGEIENLIIECRTWISVDTFLPHFCYPIGKPGIVIWSVSDPNIFGYAQNINLLKDRKYLRKEQFSFWKGVVRNPEAFVSPEVVYRALYPNKRKF